VHVACLHRRRGFTPTRRLRFEIDLGAASDKIRRPVDQIPSSANRAPGLGFVVGTRGRAAGVREREVGVRGREEGSGGWRRRRRGLGGRRQDGEEKWGLGRRRSWICAGWLRAKYPRRVSAAKAGGKFGPTRSHRPSLPTSKINRYCWWY
jgi:hypothetical protein